MSTSVLQKTEDGSEWDTLSVADSLGPFPGVPATISGYQIQI